MGPENACLLDEATVMRRGVQMTRKRLGIPLLIAIGMLLTAVVVYADMKMVNPVDAWDFEANPVPHFTHSLQPLSLIHI